MHTKCAENFYTFILLFVVKNAFVVESYNIIQVAC